MTKKQETNIWGGIAIFLIFIIAIFAILSFTGIVQLNVAGQDEKGIVLNEEDDSFSIDVCSTYTKNYPEYFFVKEHQCQAAGGDYFCEEDKAGCYDITSWDHVTMCSSAEVQALKVMCSTMDGDWTCTSTEVSCEI